MKKLILTSFIVLGMAGTVFAAATGPILGNVPSSSSNMTNPKGFNPSNNVIYGYQSAANSVGVNDRYSISTKHTSGDKIFGTTSASGTMYWGTATPGTGLTTSDIPGVPNTATDSVFVAPGGAAWSAM